MTDDRPGGAAVEPILDALDDIINSAYFVPLGIGDALAVRFKVDSLRGLPVETVAGVFDLMDRIDIEPDPDCDDEPNAMKAAAEFFQRLKEEFPAVHARWRSADENLVLNPEWAFSLALRRGEEAIEAWLGRVGTAVVPSDYEAARRRALAAIMSGFDPAALPDDAAFRRFLRKDALADYPAETRPGVYLDCWAEFVRAVLDLSPLPETQARWPY